MNETPKSVKVSVRCLVYNHASYLRDCLEGIVSQKTNFLFEAVIHDDASTDGSAEIIREQAEKYPHIIKPIFQSKNQYSQSPSLPDSYVTKACRGEYWALCEGDDYWIDPLKLQKQVDFLDVHPDYSLVCSDAVILTREGEQRWKRYDEDCDIPVKDVILKGGAWLHTVTLLYRAEIVKDWPKFASACHVGDYPLAIHAALKGKIRYLSDPTAVYRYQSIGSWTARSCIDERYFEKWLSEIRMLQGYNNFSNGVYDKFFKQRMAKFVIFYLRHLPAMRKRISQELPGFSKWFKFSDRLKWWRIRMGLNGLGRKLKKCFCHSGTSK